MVNNIEQGRGYNYGHFNYYLKGEGVFAPDKKY
jgi:hypothetical protein